MTGCAYEEVSRCEADNKATIDIHPHQGWIPNEQRLLLKFLFKVVKVFREWPMGYVWNADVNFNNNGNTTMNSRWSRVSPVQ